MVYLFIFVAVVVVISGVKHSCYVRLTSLQISLHFANIFPNVHVQFVWHVRNNYNVTYMYIVGFSAELIKCRQYTY